MFKWITCLASALYFFFVFMQVNMFNAIAPDLIKSFHLSATQVGNLSAFYFYGTVLFLFPAGMLLDRFSARRMLQLAFLIVIACTLSFALAESAWEAELARFLIGICGAFNLITSIKLISRWFPARRMALAIGLAITIGMLGAVCAQTPLTLLTDHLGWRTALMVDASFGFILLTLVTLLVRDFPPGQEARKNLEKNHLEHMGFGKAIQLTVMNPQNVLAGVYASLMNLPVFLLGANWGSLYLVQMHELSRAHASLVLTMVFIGMIVGSPAIGWFSDYIQRRKLPMMIGAVLSFLLIILIMESPSLNFTTLIILFFLIGLASSVQVIAYPLVAESNPLVLTGTSNGLAAVFIMGGGFLIPLFPYLLELNWNHALNNQVPVFSHGDFQLAFLIMPIAFLISLTVTLFVRETYCRPIQNNQFGELKITL